MGTDTLIVDDEAVPGNPHVRYARREDRHVVLKRGTRASLEREALALAMLGDRTVDVIDMIDIDGEHAELVTARVLPGDDLRPVARIDDDAATRVIAGLIVAFREHQRTARPPDPRQGAVPTDGLPDLTAVADPVRRCSDPRVPGELLDLACRLAEDLVQSADPIVVHGDLQHRNCARSLDLAGSIEGDGHSWMAIDPHGWFGDPVFEAAPILAAPESLALVHPDLRTRHDARGVDPAPLVAATARRIRIIADATGDDPVRLWAWAFVGAVIAEARMLELHDLVHGAPLSLAQGIRRQRLV